MLGRTQGRCPRRKAASPETECHRSTFPNTVPLSGVHWYRRAESAAEAELSLRCILELADWQIPAGETPASNRNVAVVWVQPKWTPSIQIKGGKPLRKVYVVTDWQANSKLPLLQR